MTPWRWIGKMVSGFNFSTKLNDIQAPATERGEAA